MENYAVNVDRVYTENIRPIMHNKRLDSHFTLTNRQRDRQISQNKAPSLVKYILMRILRHNMIWIIHTDMQL